MKAAVSNKLLNFWTKIEIRLLTGSYLYIHHPLESIYHSVK